MHGTTEKKKKKKCPLTFECFLLVIFHSLTPSTCSLAINSQLSQLYSELSLIFLSLTLKILTPFAIVLNKILYKILTSIRIIFFNGVYLITKNRKFERTAIKCLLAELSYMNKVIWGHSVYNEIKLGSLIT